MGELKVAQGAVETIVKVLGMDVIGAPLEAKADAIKMMGKSRIENEIRIKNEILNNSNLSDIEKLQLNSVFHMNIKKFMRQMKILGIALDNVDDKKAEGELDTDWLLDFFEKASNISADSMQKVLGKLLASAIEDKNVQSKTLLHALYMMSTEEMKDFMNLTRFCVVEFDDIIYSDKSLDKISAYPIIFFAKNVKKYEAHRITRLRLNKLAALGLIDVNYNKEFVFEGNSKYLRYKDRIVNVYSDEKIQIGNVIFTYDGYLLYEMVRKSYNIQILESIVSKWRKRGYEANINRR